MTIRRIRPGEPEWVRDSQGEVRRIIGTSWDEDVAGTGDRALLVVFESRPGDPPGYHDVEFADFVTPVER